MPDRHKRKTIAFRPETEADERWLRHAAAAAGMKVHAFLRKLVASARAASEIGEAGGGD